MKPAACVVLTTLLLGALCAWFISRTEQDQALTARLEAAEKRLCVLEGRPHARAQEPQPAKDPSDRMSEFPGAIDPGEVGSSGAEGDRARPDQAPVSAPAAGSVARWEDLTEDERAYLEGYNRRAGDTGFGISPCALFVRDTGSELAAITLTDAATGAPVAENAETSSWMVEIAELNGQLSEAQKRATESWTLYGPVFDSAEEALASVHPDTAARKRWRAFRARGGYVPVDVVALREDPEVVRLRDRLSLLQENHGVRLDARRFQR